MRLALQTASTCISAAAALAVLGFATGCGVSSEGLDAFEAVGQDESAIINGTLDTTHQAVVAYFGKNNSGCTATIIAVEGSTGYALTAAHCVVDPPALLVEGNDYQTATVGYKPVSYKVHPSYAPATKTSPPAYDFAMVKFTGAGPGTKVIPALKPSEDSLTTGTKVVNVGYGVTEKTNQNSKRYKVTNTISQLSSLQIRYEQEAGGTCSGDSGGPSIVTVAGGERVAAVTSFGDQNCVDFGVGGRVSAVWSTFIEPFMKGGSGGPQTCDQCFEGSTTGQGACVSKVNACFNHTDCAALVDCFQGCSSDACYQSCAQKHPAGLDVYLKINECVCETGCKAECADDPSCQTGGGGCGFTTGAAQCDSCLEGSCCAESTACADDPACTACLTSQNPDASCDSNALVNAFVGCMQGKCASPCGLSSSSSGTGSSSSTGAVTPSGAATGAGGGDAVAAGAGGGSGAGDGAGGSSGDGGSSDTETKSGGGADESGCSCAVPGASPRPIAPLALAAMGLGLIASRRRSRSRAS